MDANARRHCRNLRGEIESAALYRMFAAAELGEVYRRLASAEDGHAELWRVKLREAGNEQPSSGPSVRVRFLGWLARRFGADTVLPFVLAAKPPTSMGTKTKSGGTLARLEGGRRAAGGNALRAAMLGVNDGLVSNLSLIIGVAGAALQQTTILLTGLAALLAGAVSMALGEWLFVQLAGGVCAPDCRREGRA